MKTRIQKQEFTDSFIFVSDTVLPWETHSSLISLHLCCYKARYNPHLIFLSVQIHYYCTTTESVISLQLIWSSLHYTVMFHFAHFVFCSSISQWVKRSLTTNSRRSWDKKKILNHVSKIWTWVKWPFYYAPECTRLRLQCAMLDCIAEVIVWWTRQQPSFHCLLRFSIADAMSYTEPTFH